MIYTPPRVCRERFTVTDSEIVHVLPIYLVRLHSYLLHSYLWYLWCTSHRCSYRRNLRAPYCTYLLRLTRVRLYELSTLLAMP